MSNEATTDTAAHARAGRRADNELSLIFVFAESADVAQDMRNLLEFMDTHRVEIANPDNWQDQLDGRALSAVFLAPDVADETREVLIDEIGRLDASISVVVVNSPTDIAA